MRLQEKQNPCAGFLCSSFLSLYSILRPRSPMVFFLAKKRFCQQEQQFMPAKLPFPYCRKSTAAFLIHKSDRLAAIPEATCSLAA